MIQSGDDLDRLVRQVFGDEPPPKPLNLLKAIRLIRAGRSIREATTEGRTTLSRLSQLMSASDPILAILGGEAPALVDTVEKAVRQSLGQLVIGNVAERVFEEIYKTTLGTSEYRAEGRSGSTRRNRLPRLQWARPPGLQDQHQVPRIAVPPSEGSCWTGSGRLLCPSDVQNPCGPQSPKR